MRRKWKLGRTAVSLAVITALAAGCTTGQPDDPQPSNAPTSLGQVAQPCVADGGISVYTSTELGSDEWYAELDQVKAACFDAVVPYGSMNGTTIERSELGLDKAKKLGIGVEFSTKDILGTTDTDEVNADRHADMFGIGGDTSTDAQMKTLSQSLLRHSAVDPVLISDERPRDPEDLEQWLPALKKRAAVVHKLDKSSSIVLYWTPSSPEFYLKVKEYVQYIAIDYYPLPENNTYGPVSAISSIGETLWRTAGSNGTFVVQAFGWDPEVQEDAFDLGFTEQSPAPTAAQMVEMARLAVVGYDGHGAMNLAFYLAGEPGSASLATMGDAVRQIRQADWWINRGKR